MNYENIIRTRDAIAEEVVVFNMNWWLGEVEPGCGTVACIGGMAQLLAMRDNPSLPSRPNSAIAQKFLGLDIYHSHRLFYGRWTPNVPVYLERITREMAVKQLNFLVENNRIATFEELGIPIEDVAKQIYLQAAY